MINADWKWDSETGTFVVFNADDESFIGTAESCAEACEMVERLKESQLPVNLKLTKLTHEDLIGYPLNTSDKKGTNEDHELPQWFKDFLC